METKRIAIDASPLFNPRCGIGRTTKALIEYVAQCRLPAQYEIVLFARRALGPSLKALVNLPFALRQLRLPRFCEPFIRNMKLVERLCSADLYHATDFYLPLDSKALTVTTVYDVIFEKASEDLVDHERLRKWVRGFVKNSQQIITISEYSKKEIVNTYQIDPERVHVIYLGVDRGSFHPPEDRCLTMETVSKRFGLKRRFFLAVSCDMGRKNTPRLLEAYKQLLRSGATIDLVLLWTPPPEIKQKFSTAEFSGHIHFLGKEDEHTLGNLYAAAEAVIYPSIAEGFGLPILEAMSCGTPVIASGTTSLPEVGGDAAIYVDPMSVSSIFSALERFENGTVDLGGMRQRCLIQASGFSWRKCAQETLEIYDRVLTG